MDMKTSKKLILLIFVLFVFVSFCSCERYGTEIEDMMIIEGIAVDEAPEGFEVTVEMLNNKQSASADSSNVGDEMTLVYSAKGETIAEALRLIINKTGTVPTYIHNKVIILSEDILNQNISRFLDFFERDYTTQPVTLLCVAKNIKAGELLRADVGSDISKSEELEKILLQSALSSITPQIRLIDAINTILDDTSCVVLPAVELESNDKSSSFFVENIAVFDYDNKFAFYLDRKMSESTVKLLGEMKNGTLVTEDENGNKATFIIVEGKSNYDVILSGDKLLYKVNVKMYCDLNSYQSQGFRMLDKETLYILEENIEKETELKIKKTYTNIIENGSYDIFRLGRRLLQKNYGVYRKKCTEWQNSMKNSNLSVEVEVIIRRTGEENYPN